MNRQILPCLMLVLSMAMAAGTAAAPAHHAGNRMIPVIVNVDAHGKVTDVTPAYNLHPSFVRKLRETLQHMIEKPAMRHG